MLNTKWFWLILIVLMAGCDTAVPETTPDTTRPPLATAVALPPTFTVPAASALPPTPTFRPLPTAAASATPVNFNQTAVELRYTIPAIGLDRRLQGSIGSQIVVVDETTGDARQYNNQAAVLLQLQQVLPDLVLEPLPADCPTCVYITFNLPLAEEAGEGWLQDETLLASLDNFMSTRLGPHFPPGTQLGLRRGPTAYAPAHTLALLADGSLWRWLSTDSQLAPPVDGAVAAPNLTSILNALPGDSLAASYVVDCAGTAVETLLINPDTAPLRISCPEFSLPSTLLPLYLALDDLLAPTIADVSLPRPPAAFPLTAVLDYQRADGYRLTLHYDGQAVLIEDTAVIYTDTLPISQVISITTGLLDSGQLQPGLTTFQPTATPIVTATIESEPESTSRLLARGFDGVYDGQWTGVPDLVELNALLEALLPEPAVTPTP